MFGRLLLWVRRNSRKAIALVLAPGLIALAFDAAVAHWAGKDMDNRLQAVPVVYGLVGALLVMAVCLPRSRAVFAWTSRGVGAVGVLVGLVGTGVHTASFFKELAGQYTLSGLEGAFSVAPPLLAPLGFTGLGAILLLLPSARLLLRLKVGSPPASVGSTSTHLPVPGSEIPRREERKSA